MGSNLINTFPSVIVLMPTYNHEMYIAQAIESVLNQITNFDVHLYVSDDASTDCTFSIASTYSNRNKVVIKLTRKENNIGAILNGAWLRNESLNSGCKYSAILEGDDYWTDPYKLQKQVDFLESNLDFCICFHPVNVLSTDGTFTRDIGVSDLLPYSESDIYDLATFGNYMHTPSVVFRNLIREFPANFKQTIMGDYFLWMLLAEKGKIKRLEDCMAVYRKGVGIQSGIGEKQFFIDFSKSLALISASIENITVTHILKYKIDSIRFNFLPFVIKNTLDSKDVSKGIVLRKHVKIIELFKAIYYKIFNI